MSCYVPWRGTWVTGVWCGGVLGGPPPPGIAHVEVGSDEEAGRVLSLNGKELLGRWISVRT
jgi:hypothetical protein